MLIDGGLADKSVYAAHKVFILYFRSFTGWNPDTPSWIPACKICNSQMVGFFFPKAVVYSEFTLGMKIHKKQCEALNNYSANLPSVC